VSSWKSSTRGADGKFELGPTGKAKSLLKGNGAKINLGQEFKEIGWECCSQKRD
jgi:hypothetical protein